MNISSKLLQAMREVLELPPFSDNAAQVYLLALHDIDEKAIERALIAWAREKMEEGFPTSADLRALIETMREASQQHTTAEGGAPCR